MAWLIMLLVWVAVTALVGYPYVEKIEKLRYDREKFFSHFAVGGWCDIVMVIEKRFGREMCVLIKK